MLGTIQTAVTVVASQNATEQVYSSPGTYTFTVPDDVTSLSVVCIGGGAGTFVRLPTSPNRAGEGGALAYRNNISVTPGEEIVVVVGAGAAPSSAPNYPRGGNSSFGSECVAAGGKVFSGDSRPIVGDAGFLGGQAVGSSGGGGGAGGYAGVGGNGGEEYTGFGSQHIGSSGSGGAGGGGGGGTPGNGGAGGGGTGLYGQGPSGSGGGLRSPGGGGSGGENGTRTNGGGPGGGAGALDGAGADGAVRIIWPGNLRSFPTTRTGTE